MGQKVHPLGFRVGITKKHQSQWFARFHKHKYAQTILEDRFLRQTLLQLFPELVNPVVQKAKKRDDNKQIVPKITHIKIERGLIPYEIGIQIHAGNCELIKSALDNLKTNSTLLTNLQKTRRYLLDLRLKLKDVLKLKQTTKTKRSNRPGRIKTSRAKQRLKTQKFYQKRLKKHQNISRFFRQNLLENVMIIKKGKKILRKFQSLSLKKTSLSLNKKNAKTSFNSRQRSISSSKIKKAESSPRQNLKTNRIARQTSLQPAFSSKSIAFNMPPAGNIKRDGNPLILSGILKGDLSTSTAKTKKKFFEIFLNKTNKNFIFFLKQQMHFWNNLMKNHREQQLQKYGMLRYAPVGYLKKWSLNRLERMQKQPYVVLKKLMKFDFYIIP